MLCEAVDPGGEWRGAEAARVVPFSARLGRVVAGGIGLLATVVATMFCLAEGFIALEVVDVRG